MSSKKKELISLIFTGVVLSILLKQTFHLSGWRFVSDLFFALGMVCLVYGLYRQINNLGVFNSLKYGFRTVVRIILNKKPASGEIKTGYFEYVKSRPKHGSVPGILVISAGFLFISVIMAFVAG